MPTPMPSPPPIPFAVSPSPLHPHPLAHSYTPNLLSATFRTPASVATSLLMYVAFLFTVGYTAYFWLAT